MVGPDVLKIQEVETPSPKGNEVLIRVHAVSVNFGDIIARNFKNITAKEFNMPLLFWILARFGFGYGKPKIKILGNSFAGEVVTIGNEVLLYKKGDSVFTTWEYGCLCSVSLYARKWYSLLQNLQK